jgi:hypothetical protein
MVAFSIAGVASGEPPIRVVDGNLEALFNGGILLKAPSKTKPTRAAVVLSARFETRDGSHVPALRRFLFLGDRNVDVDVRGIPICRLDRIRGKFTRDAEAVCRGALIGTGMASSQVLLSTRQKPISGPGPRLLVFNGGVKKGVTTIFIHTYLEAPVSQAFVATVRLKPIRVGPYGLAAVATIPRIAAGKGSLTSFNLNLLRGIRATCAEGDLSAEGTAVFANGARLGATLTRKCVS